MIHEKNRRKLLFLSCIGLCPQLLLKSAIVRRPRYKAAVHVSDFDTFVPALELKFANARNDPFRNLFKNMTTNFIGSDSSGAGTRMAKFGT